MTANGVDQQKRAAAEKALEFVEAGMKLGLGSGSTADHFIDLLAERVRAGLDVVGVPTSEATAHRAREGGIRLTSLDEHPYLDLTVDGADEIDPELRLIKGGGGALLHEKIVATSSERMVVVADRSKKVTALGRFPLPVEVTPFGVTATQSMIIGLASDAGCEGDVVLRKDASGAPYKTDGGNLIYDCHFTRIPEPEVLCEALQMIPGVVEHGLFIGLADVAIIAGPNDLEILYLPELDDEDETL